MANSSGPGACSSVAKMPMSAVWLLWRNTLRSLRCLLETAQLFLGRVSEVPQPPVHSLTWRSACPKVWVHLKIQYKSR